MENREILLRVRRPAVVIFPFDDPEGSPPGLLTAPELPVSLQLRDPVLRFIGPALTVPVLTGPVPPGFPIGVA
ncbi:MAG: hypothetical protein OEM32_04035 [Acidimicrobiia bacterium]|nr:hypothetical protein [Acidimicrobiia bacterium]